MWLSTCAVVTPRIAAVTAFSTSWADGATGVAVGSLVAVGAGVTVGAGVDVGVETAVGVAAGVAVGMGAETAVGAAAGVAVGMGAETGVGARVGVEAGVRSGAAVESAGAASSEQATAVRATMAASAKRRTVLRRHAATGQARTGKPLTLPPRCRYEPCLEAFHGLVDLFPRDRQRRHQPHGVGAKRVEQHARLVAGPDHRGRNVGFEEHRP